MLTQLPFLHYRGARRWFCSELAAWALGLDRPEQFTPQALFDYLNAMNRTFDAGRIDISD